MDLTQTISPGSRVSDLFDLDKTQKRTSSLQRQLYAQMRTAILERVIREGTRLPASRTFAKELGISRNTVVAVYDQMIAEGFLDATQGAGTYVSDLKLIERTKFVSRVRKSLPTRSSSSRIFDSSLGGLSLFAGLVDGAQFPYRLWNGAFANASRNLDASLELYDENAGYAPLREAIAKHLIITRGVNAEVDQIFITSGAAQSLFLITRALDTENAAVWMEDPGYSVATAAFKYAGFAIQPIPIDREGMNPSAVKGKKHQARLIYATTSYQYPLGFTMSIRRRLDLLDHASQMKAWIIEDDYDGEFRYQGNPVPAMFGLMENNRTIYLGTFSKTLAPSLRISFVVVPSTLVGKFREIYPGLGNISVIAVQSALSELIAKGHFARHIDRMTKLYGARRETLQRALAEVCGLDAEGVATAPGGLHIPVRLVGKTTDHQLSEEFAAHRIGCQVLSDCFVTRMRRKNGFLLGFTATDELDIRQSVEIVQQIVRGQGLKLSLQGLTNV